LASARGWAADFQEIIMFSKKFLAWVGVGVLSVATIPTLAAPELARLAARHHATRTATAHKLTHKKTATKTAAKAPVKKLAATPVKHKATALTAITKKKTTSTHAVKLHATRPTHTTAKTITHKPLTLIHKPVAAHKTVALSHKPTPASTAKKLLH
jgi:hypothetical protein